MPLKFDTYSGSDFGRRVCLFTAMNGSTVIPCAVSFELMDDLERSRELGGKRVSQVL
jgi:hypothetical protein